MCRTHMNIGLEPWTTRMRIQHSAHFLQWLKWTGIDSSSTINSTLSSSQFTPQLGKTKASRCKAHQRLSFTLS
uniref:Uncharacterized protein n=1 Tax=Arundo donax TaxID=35708 RepID=A0A0A9EGC5_ARUDO